MKNINLLKLIYKKNYEKMKNLKKYLKNKIKI
jgi:hypothetical protein